MREQVAWVAAALVASVGRVERGQSEIVWGEVGWVIASAVDAWEAGASVVVEVLSVVVVVLAVVVVGCD